MIELTPVQSEVVKALGELFTSMKRPVRRFEIERHLGRGRIDPHLRILVAGGAIKRVAYGGYIPYWAEVVL